MIRFLFVIFLGAFVAPVSHAGDGKIDPCFKNMPVGCSLIASKEVKKERTAAIGKKLGGWIARITSNTLNIYGKRIEVIFIDARTEGDGARIFKAVSKLKDDPAFCLRKGKRVIEFLGTNAALATKTSYEFGFVKKPREILYRLDAELVPVAKADYMALTKVLTLVLTAASGGPDKKTLREIEKTIEPFEFGKTLYLREPILDGDGKGFRFDPEPIAVDGPDKTGCTLFTFDELPTRHEIPYVVVTARIAVDDTGLTRTERDDLETLLAPTDFWPVADPEIAALARKIIGPKTSTESKVDALIEWLAPNRNIKYGGPVVGSRWGVRRVLDQKYGRCWDFSDTFITLCRASGIPCRQVNGWLYGMSGHVWAEVLLPGKGWQQVDPSGGGILDCGIYHIPYFTTEDGEMPVLLLSLPKVEMVETD